MLRELCTYACAYTVAPYSHALTRDNNYYCTSCTDVKRRVYETLQREQVQNGRPCRRSYNAEVPYLRNEAVSEEKPTNILTYVAR